MNYSGVTLIELIIVVAIVGILAVALGFTYVGWQGGYKVEQTIKGIYSDLMAARFTAMTTNQPYLADFPATYQYRIMADANNDGVANDVPLATFPKTIEYPIIITSLGGVNGLLTFNTKGVISANNLTAAVPAVAICLDTKSATTVSDYDCIKISQTRMVMGKLSTPIVNGVGGPCNAATCIAK